MEKQGKKLVMNNSLEKESRVELDNKQAQIIDELKPLRALKAHYKNTGNSKKLSHVIDYIRRLERSLHLVETQKEIFDQRTLNMILDQSKRISELENRIEKMENERSDDTKH
jgi:hypothetical protein